MQNTSHELSEKQVKRCHTVNAWTLYKGKTLLVKHKKLGIWLAPGGHVEENELPHQAAEREFFEETGVKVRALSAQKDVLTASTSEYLPLPFYCNLHEVNKPRGNSFCEQHYSWGYYVEVIDDSGFGKEDDGVTGIGWFDMKDLQTIETTEDIRQEGLAVFTHFP